MVMVEPRGTGMAPFTLRAADEVRPAQFGGAEGDLDIEMVVLARTIIRQRSGTFDRAPRSLPRGVTRADRNEAEEPAHQTQRSSRRPR
jgi:hypothetical protein